MLTQCGHGEMDQLLLQNIDFLLLAKKTACNTAFSVRFDDPTGKKDNK